MMENFNQNAQIRELPNLNTFFNFSVRLTSPLSQITLPNVAKLPNIRKLKIKMMSYITNDIDQESIVISVNGFTKNSIYIDGNVNKPYTLLLPLNKQAFAQNYYFNKTSNSSSDFDVILEQPIQNQGNLQIEVLIGDTTTGTILYRPEWINNSTPVILEILLSQ